MQSLEEFAEKMWEQGAYMIGVTEQVMQTCVMQDASGAMEIHVCPWRDAEERRLILALLREKLKNYERYAFTSEAWAAAYDISDAQNPAEAMRHKGMPSERPDRRSVLIVIATDRAGAKIGYCADIIEGKKRTLAERNSGGMAGGDLLNLFSPRITQ